MPTAAQILDTIKSRFAGLDILETPGATFVYYDPARDIPHDKRQPWATIVTKDDYDHASNLEARGAFRLNLGVRLATYRAQLGPPPAWGKGGGPVETAHDLTREDTILPHPIYAPMGWVSIINPSDASWPSVLALVEEAYDQARERHKPRAAKA